MTWSLAKTIILSIASGCLGVALTLLFVWNDRPNDTTNITAATQPTYVRPQKPRSMPLHADIYFDNVQAFDQSIGPRSPDQEFASEFITTFYSGGVVSIIGIASKESSWGGISAATILVPNGNDRIDIDYPASAKGCLDCADILEVRDNAAPEWKSHVIGQEVAVTGELLRRYKPSIEQRSRMWSRLHPGSKTDGNMTSYRGGCYTYLIIPTDIKVRLDGAAKQQ